MESAQTFRRLSLTASTVAMFAAILIAFVLGGIGGYAVKAVSSTSVASSHGAGAACPQGMHAVVWYTARTWSCQSDS